MTLAKKNIGEFLRCFFMKEYDFLIGISFGFGLLLFFTFVITTTLGIYDAKWSFLGQSSELRDRFNLVRQKSLPPQLPSKRFYPRKKSDFTPLALPSASAAIVVDVESGEMLFNKEAVRARAIASITKLLTAMIVVDQERDLDRFVTVTDNILGIEGTVVGCRNTGSCDGERLRSGENLRVRDLLQATLISSSNDAATLLAQHIAGNEEEFAKLMNLRARELHMNNSNFCRPSGLQLDDPLKEAQCNSTAKDIALLSLEIVRNEKYAVIYDMLTTQKATITSEDGTITHELVSTNKLVESDVVIGGKTGTTPRAGQGFMAIGEVGGIQKNALISVILDSSQRFTDAERLLEWSSENYTWPAR